MEYELLIKIKHHSFFLIFLVLTKLMTVIMGKMIDYTIIVILHINKDS